MRYINLRLTYLLTYCMKYLVAMYQTIAGAHQVGSACHVVHTDPQSSATVRRQHTVYTYIYSQKTYKRNKSGPSTLA